MLEGALFSYNIWCYYFIVFPNRSCNTLNHFWVWSWTHHPGSSRRHQVLMVTWRWNSALFIWSNGLLNHWSGIILRRNWTDLIKSLSVWEMAAFSSCFVHLLTHHAPSNIHQRSALLLVIESISKWHEWGICLHALMLNMECSGIGLEFPGIWPGWRLQVHFLCKIWMDGWSMLSREQSSRLLKSMRCLAFLTTWPQSIPASVSLASWMPARCQWTQL